MDDSTSTSDDDDENNEAARVFRPRINMDVDRMTDEQFVSDFRLNKAGFEYVHEHVADLIRPKRMYAYTLSTRRRLLVCIRYENFAV